MRVVLGTLKYNFTIRVSSELGIDSEQVWTAGKHPITVKARSLMCYWAVRKLGFSATELSKKLGISQPSVSISVKRGEKIAKAMQLELIKGYIIIILWASPMSSRRLFPPEFGNP
jgi:hypothetical protein